MEKTLQTDDKKVEEKRVWNVPQIEDLDVTNGTQAGFTGGPSDGASSYS